MGLQQIHIEVFFEISLYEKISLKILHSSVESSPRGELSEILIDSKLAFFKYVINLSFKANQKLYDTFDHA